MTMSFALQWFASGQRFLQQDCPIQPWPLLEAIVVREADLRDLSNLFLPSEIVDYTPRSHAAGLPKHLLPIASDSLGIPFVYDKRDLANGQVQNAPVYFWDNDFGTLDQVGTSFEDWIASYSEDWSKGLNYDDF